MRKLDYEFIFTCGIVAFIAALGMVAGSGGLCYTRVMGTWKSKTDTNICYSIILFSYASIERNC